MVRKCHIWRLIDKRDFVMNVNQCIFIEDRALN